MKKEERKIKKVINISFLLFALCSLLFSFFIGCGSFGAASAEEYYAIGMAYYDMGKFEDAEKWLNRARAKDRTKSASEYNLGRIAFETKRYEDAVKHFEAVLKRDPVNVLALKAAAYTYIRMGDIEKAAALYDRVLVLVPESSDDGYNYALVLYAMEKYAEAEQVLKNHEFALLDNNDVLLLYARAQKEQGKPEAIDTYAKWLVNNTDAKVRHEYGQLLETHEMYARALEEYRLAMEGLAAGAEDPSKQDVRFAIARLQLIADADKSDGITELKEAVTEGFADKEKIAALLDDERISAANKEELKTIIAELERAAAEAAKAAAEAEAAKAAGETETEETEPAAPTEGET